MKSCHLHTDFLVILQCNKFKKKNSLFNCKRVPGSVQFKEIGRCAFLYSSRQHDKCFSSNSFHWLYLCCCGQAERHGFASSCWILAIFCQLCRISCLISSPGLALERSEIFSVKLRQCWVLPQVIKCLSLSTIIQTFTYTSDQSGIARHSSQLCEQKQ